MEKQQTILHNPPAIDKIERFVVTYDHIAKRIYSLNLIFYWYSRKPPKTFAFDHCFYSLNPSDENFASQETVFDCVGRDILDNAFQGYNACIFAYGQTGIVCLLNMQ